jgi:hypothetical protein
LNCSSYFVMKNTPKVGFMSNFWGAVHDAPFLLLRCKSSRSAPGG